MKKELITAFAGTMLFLFTAYSLVVTNPLIWALIPLWFLLVGYITYQEYLTSKTQKINNSIQEQIDQVAKKVQEMDNKFEMLKLRR